jgi:catechol 2,3-dioxygenase-like lactoylglutathione lyase family enzyme
MGGGALPELRGFHHVKLPVADVGRSRDWYRRVLGFETEIEFVEDGVLMGVALRDPAGSVRLAFRSDAKRTSALAGFDPIALAVSTRYELEAWARHLEDLKQPHGGIVTGHIGWVIVGLTDPDGMEVRLYTLEEHGEASKT